MIKTLSGFNRNKVVNLKQVYSDPLIKMKKYADAFTSIGPGLDLNGFPSTGLTEDFVDGGKPVLGTRKALEQELDLAEGTLKQSSPYWASYGVRIGSDTIALNLSDPHDLLKYCFLRGQTIVANGLDKIGSDSRVEYVLYSEEQEAETRVKGRKSLKAAYNLAERLDLETKINILAVHNIIVDASSANTIEDKLDEIMEKNPDAFIKLVSDDYLVFRSLVTKCLDSGILTTEDGAVYHGDIVVGYTKEAAAEAVAKDSTLTAILKAKLTGDMDLISKALKAKVNNEEDLTPNLNPAINLEENPFKGASGKK